MAPHVRGGAATESLQGSKAMVSFHPSYIHEINLLNVSLDHERPADCVQYCADHFQRRLETQRQAYLLHQAAQGHRVHYHPAPRHRHHPAQPVTEGQQAASSSSQLPAANAAAAASTTASARPVDPSPSFIYLPFHAPIPGSLSSFAIDDSKGSEDKSSTSRKRSIAMAQTTFTSPFGASAGNPIMEQVREEDEMDGVQSPTATTFAQSAGDSPFGSVRFTPGDSPFGGSFDPAQSGPPSYGGGGSNNQMPANYQLGRRTSVSAESMNPTASSSDSWTPPSHPKTPEQVARLKTAVSNNFLFTHLQDEQASQVLGALVEKPLPAKGIKIISQGDAGDYFYVVERGSFDVHIHPSGTLQPGKDGMGDKVASIGPGGSFGELALMYNAPRAATIISTESDSLLWALDRITFRRILMDSAFQRRRMYESFLEEVPLLSALTAYERSKIADALETQKFADGEQIIKEGDIGEAFYILETGTANVTKQESGSEVLHTYSKGDYFGELALLNDKPRAATVAAVGEVKVASLGKEGFRRLLGPVEERMRENDPSKRSIKAKTSTEEVDPLSK